MIRKYKIESQIDLKILVSNVNNKVILQRGFKSSEKKIVGNILLIKHKDLRDDKNQLV